MNVNGGDIIRDGVTDQLLSTMFIKYVMIA